MPALLLWQHARSLGRSMAGRRRWVLSGWVVALADQNFTTIALRQIKSFAELFCDGERPSLAGVDMPTGLPEQTGPRGRTPERLVRPLLGARQSSVFSIPSRAAVYAGADADEPDERTRFLSACDIARATSAQGRAVAKQGFHIFPKVGVEGPNPFARSKISIT